MGPMAKAGPPILQASVMARVKWKLPILAHLLSLGPKFAHPKGPSNGIVYTFGAQISTKYLLL